LKRGEIIERWWLNRVREINREVEAMRWRIEEQGSMEVRLNQLERLRRRGEKASQWLRERGLVV